MIVYGFFTLNKVLVVFHFYYVFTGFVTIEYSVWEKRDINVTNK